MRLLSFGLDFPLYEIMKLIILGLRYVILNPFFWAVSGMTFFQYRRLQRVEKAIYGVVRESAFMQFLVTLGLGLMGGILGSLLFAFVGVSVNDAGIMYLWLTAFCLMLIQPRFMCFAYAAGVVAALKMITGSPEVSIPAILGIVSVLHIVEGLLIYISGYFGCIPVAFENDNGRVIGGFVIQKYWPIPIMVLIAGFTDMQLTEGMIHMPDWWPLIGAIGTIPPGRELVYTMLPVAVAAGYSDIALTRYPRERARATAFALEAYSLILLIMAVLADRMAAFQVIGALFAPLGHELVILLGQNAEVEGTPRFASPEDGIMVLDVLPGSAAEELGIRTGDVIKKVNGLPVTCWDDFYYVLQMTQFYLNIELDAQDDFGNPVRETKEFTGNPEQLGILFVPETVEGGHVRLANMSFIRLMLSRLQRLFRRR